MKVYILNLGCPKNVVDGEVIAGHLLKREGVELTTDLDNADTVIINTCAFIKEAVEESDTYIREFIERKRERRLNKIIVCGCLTERYKRKILNIYPEVDAFIGTEHPRGVVEILENKKSRRFILSRKSRCPPIHERALSTEFYAYVKISEGCSRKCAFCIIPVIRGPYRSKSLNMIISELKRLAERGIKEIIFVSQDTTFYGKDIYRKPSLLKLLKVVDKIEGIQWIRLLYCYPAYFSNDLIEFIASSEKVVKYLDIPVQHISKNVLRRMKRGTSPERIRKLIDMLRERIPNVFLRTSLIVGFPGETQEDFKELLKFIKEYPFEYLGVFPYSDEEEAQSYKMKDKIPLKIIKERVEKVMSVQKGVSSDVLKKRIGKVIPAIIEKPHPQAGTVFIGRIYGQAPEIDGITYIRGKNIKTGEIKRVRIISSFDYDLEGVVEE